MEMKEDKAVTDERILVMVSPHPLIKHWSFVLRNEQTSLSSPWRLFPEFFHPPLYRNQSFEEVLETIEEVILLCIPFRVSLNGYGPDKC